MLIIQIVVVSLVLLFGWVVFCGAPYVPSQKKYIARAFTSLYQLDRNDVLLDIGSGGGVVLRMASKRAAKAIGYEINPALVIISKLLSIHNKKVQIHLADLWKKNIPDDTTVIYVFAVSRDINKILIKIQNEANRLSRSLKVISYGSGFDNIKPDKELDAYRLYTVRPLQRQ